MAKPILRDAETKDMGNIITMMERFIEREMERLELGQVVSIIGRFWALDRENNWDRIKKTYNMLVDNQTSL